jgi:hypothetical protein
VRGSASWLNAIMQRSVEPLKLVDETRSARFLTKLDLAVAYIQIRIQQEDQFKTSSSCIRSSADLHCSLTEIKLT